MAVEEQVHLQCRFWMHSDEKTVRSRLEAMEGFVRWTMLRGPAGGMDGMVALLEDCVMVALWRDAGGAMFRAEEGVPLEVGPGELYGLQIDLPAAMSQEGVALRDRVLKQLEAISAYDYAVALIEAAVEERPEVLDLSGKGLDELPAQIGMLTELAALDLSRNRLTKLPAEIGRLTKLEELILSENRLVDLPAEVGELMELRKLVLDNNRLVSLPVEIGRLRQLRDLHVIENALTKLPAEIGQLVNLQYLWLQHNQLTALPVELCQMSRLNDWVPDGKHLPPRFAFALQLQGNPLLDPPPDVVCKGSHAVRDYLGYRECPYKVWVIKNISKLNPDRKERWYVLGYYKDWAAAVAASEKVIDDSLATLPPGPAKELYRLYALRGLEPRIGGRMEVGKEDAPTFSARQYAKRRCEEIAGQRESEWARQAMVGSGNAMTHPPPKVGSHGTQAMLSHLDASEPFYRVLVVENAGLPNMKPNEQGRELGRFNDYASAAAAGYKVIDDYLAGLAYVTADELFDACRRFGPEPRIESNFVCVFDPFMYASRRCKEIAAERAQKQVDLESRERESLR
jgi:hypothetical protein